MPEWEWKESLIGMEYLMLQVKMVEKGVEKVEQEMKDHMDQMEILLLLLDVVDLQVGEADSVVVVVDHQEEVEVVEIYSDLHYREECLHHLVDLVHRR